MTAFPIAASLAEALKADAPRARTAEEAAERVGGAVFLAAEEAPGRFATPAAAEDAYPDLYGGGQFELYWREDSWRVALRFWRPAAPAPVGRSLDSVVKKPLGRARNPEEARAILGQPAELVSEAHPTLYASRRALMKRWGDRVDTGIAQIIEREGKLAVLISYWKPAPPPNAMAPLAPAERSELAERIGAPMRSDLPQQPMDIGLFEQPAPENPDIVLAEEGDGRVRGE